MANRSRNILLRLTGDSSDAKQAVRSVRDELREFSRTQATAHIDVQIAEAERQLLGFRRQFDELSRRDASPKVTLETGQVARKIETLELRLLRLGRRKVTIDVDVKRGTLERTAAGLAAVDRGLDNAAKGVGNFFRAIPVVGQMFGTLVDGVVGLGNALGSMAEAGVTSLAKLVPSLVGLASPLGSLVGIVFNVVAGLTGLAALGGAVIIALNAIVGAIIALAGAAVALVASLAAAAGGLAAIGVALGGVLLPVLAVGIALFQRFHAILQARQAREQALTQSIQEQKTAEQARAAALQGVKTAQQQLADATVAGNRAMTQSVLDLRDAQLGLQSSQLGVKEARLGVLEAKKALRDLLAQSGAKGNSLNSLLQKATTVGTDPAAQRALVGDIRSSGGRVDPLALQRAILNVQRAQLGVKEAINQTAHSEDNLGQATKKRADFVRRGIAAYAPYRNALQAVQKAEARLQTAENQTSRAHDKYERALKKLSGTERQTLSNLDKFMAKFKEMAKVVTAPIFAALNSAFDKLSGTSTGLLGPLKGIGTAMGDVIRAFADFLAQPATLSAFRTMATGAGQLVRELGAHAFISFLSIMRDVATTALPAVQAAAKGVSTWLGRIAAQPGRIHSVVQTLIGQFQTWLKFAGAVSRLVLALFSNAAPAGQSLATSMTRIVNHWTAWIRANPGAVRRFFNEAIAKTKAIVSGIKNIVTWLKDHLPKAAATAKSAFSGLYNIVKKVVDGIRFIQNMSTDVANTLGLGASPKDVQQIITGDFKALNRDLADLKKHLTPERRTAVRGDVIRILNELLSQRGSVGRQIEIDPVERAGLQGLLNKMLATQGNTPRSRAPQGRRAPNEPRAGSAALAGAGNVFNITVPRPLDTSKPIDPDNTAALLAQALERRGGIR